uniref:Uncharacterized protein n=1 Tax=Branchiostoma floridae TaxID=7739 RepID=C3XWB3_BRAFL|eukprot:XP_002611637.1 hypothetical protein BRAFLDRAFT_63698 [Branchiostoma floridae]
MKEVILSLLRKRSHIDKISLSLRPKKSLTPPAGLAGKPPGVRELFVLWENMKTAATVSVPLLAICFFAGMWTTGVYYNYYKEAVNEGIPEPQRKWRHSKTQTRLQEGLDVWARRNHSYHDVTKVLYNRVPKCGSNTMKVLLRELQNRNRFQFFEDKDYGLKALPNKLLTFDDCVLNNLWECDEFGPKTFTMTQFFCGQESICMEPSQMAVEVAKENIRRHYAVVGVLEEFSSFLKVLEVVMPQFFRGAHDTWRKIESKQMEHQKTAIKIPPSNESREIMRERLHLDYQVYDFIKERFHRQKTQLGVKD